MAISDIPPGLFTLIAEALGIYIAKNLRLNDQSAVGNWVELVGQAILTFNAQQQLRQQGPGTAPPNGVNYEFARLAAAIPLSLIVGELPTDLLQDPVLQQKLAREQGELNGKTQENQSPALQQTSGSDNINTLDSRIESLESKIQQLQLQLDALRKDKPDE